MSELSDRMLRDMQLAGLVEGTRQQYLRAVRQLAAYYMVPPDRLSERQVEQYLLYVRDDLGVAKGTFEPIVAGLKFFYLQTLGYDWPLLTKKKSASLARSGYPTSAAMPIAAAELFFVFGTPGPSKSWCRVTPAAAPNPAPSRRLSSRLARRPVPPIPGVSVSSMPM